MDSLTQACKLFLLPFRQSNAKITPLPSTDCCWTKRATENTAVLSQKHFQAQKLGKTTSEPRKTKVYLNSLKKLFARHKAKKMAILSEKAVSGRFGTDSLKNLCLWTKNAKNANFAQKPFLGNFPPLLCGNLGVLCGNLPCCAGNCAGICLFVREFSEKPCNG